MLAVLSGVVRPAVWPFRRMATAARWGRIWSSRTYVFFGLQQRRDRGVLAAVKRPLVLPDHNSVANASVLRAMSAIGSDDMSRRLDSADHKRHLIFAIETARLSYRSISCTGQAEPSLSSAPAQIGGDARLSQTRGQRAWGEARRVGVEGPKQAAAQVCRFTVLPFRLARSPVVIEESTPGGVKIPQRWLARAYDGLSCRRSG
jgi:hypothetical protein